MAAAVSSLSLAPSLPPRQSTLTDTTPTSSSPTLKRRPHSLSLTHTTSLPLPTPPPSGPSKQTLKAGLHSLSCRACSAFANMSSSRYHPSSSSKRTLSPGARNIANVGRSSEGNFGSAYAGNYNSYNDGGGGHRHSYTPVSSSTARKSGASGGGVIPISTEIVYNDKYAPSSSSSGGGASVIRDGYSGRPRRTSDLGSAAPPPLRSRPAIVQERIPRPSSPLSYGYKDDGYNVKSNTSVRRSEPKTTTSKLYSVDNNSAKLIAETSYGSSDRERESRREGAGYHRTGPKSASHYRAPPREIMESEWSYTDPAGMYETTEPVRRHHQRRGSVDGRRPVSVIEPAAYGLASSYQRGSRDYGPPPTLRQVDKVNELARGASVREPVRGSSRERQGSYDNYALPPEPYLRSATTMPVVVNQQPEHRHLSRDETYRPRYDERDYYDERVPRQPTRQFTDEGVASRGFGLRMPSVDGRAHGGSSSSSMEPPVPRAAYPPQAVPGYGGEAPLAKMPSTSEYLPPPPPREAPRERDVPREREREREYDREYVERPKERYDDRPREREREREVERPKERERDRPRERDYEREDRDRAEPRHHHRRLSRDTSDASSGARDSVRDVAGPAAATAAGVAGVAAAGAAIEKKRSERKYDSEDEERRRPRREPADRERDAARDAPRDVPREAVRRDPNDREDERERRYAEKDREEKRRDDKPAVDPDEEYRRRVAAMQADLASSGDGVLIKQRSRDEDSERERQRRRDREDRERERRQSRDRAPDTRRGSDENTASPRPRASSRARAPSVDSEAPHNRLPERHITDRNYVQEPDSIPGAYPPEPMQAGGAMMPPPPPPSSVRPPPPPSALPIPDITPRSKSVDPTAADRRVTIVEPSKTNLPTEPKVKGILRKPTEKFPEHPDAVREGVTPLKDRLEKDGGKGIPDGAKWTKIDRRLVNPQALEEKGERFEERQEHVIVLRVLTKDEIQKFADRTSEIREEREERYNREKKRHSTSSRRHHHDDTDDSEDRDYRHSSRRHRDDEERDRDRDGGHRHSRDDDGGRERERERERDRDREKDRDREREKDRDRERERERERDREPRSSRKEYEDNYDVESDAAMRAIEDGRRRDRGEKRDLRDEYMSTSSGGR